MDDIYDDLDNYEDLNIVEDLKKENHDLKLKLEEYTIAMSKLQKNILQDFDKLSSDFKKLETNYSSLLKTAKIEIERKTKIITDLNIEKDIIVLNALQNRNVNDVRKLKSIPKPLIKGPSNDSSLGKAKRNDPLTDNKGNNNSGRKDDVRFSSVDTTTTSGNTEIATKLMQFANNNSQNVELWSDRTSDTKENMTQRNKNVENNKSANTRALSIKNRRKSMPAVRSHAKYSSDEECEDRFCSNDVNRKSSKEEPNRQNIDKVHSDRHRYKGLEERIKPDMSNVDDKYYGFHEPSRETGNKQPYYRSRNDRHHGNEKHRSRNKYDISLRHRRHFSPERSRRARNEDYQRQDYGRFRVLESPPPDKFQHYQSRNQETRFKRDRDDTYELGTRDNRYDKYSSKHKTNSEQHYDEPISKRQRTDSFNKFSEDDTRWSRERPLEKLYETLHQDLSCQSPDYIIADAGPSHPIREIMNTASTPLEDPRIHSKRYILKTADDNVALSTVIGRNVDLKILDTSHWNDKPAEVPKSLTRRPSQFSDDIVKEMYMEMDNPVSNMSTESGEILSFDVKDKLHEVRNVPNKNNIQRYESIVGTDSVKLPDKNDDKNCLTKYKIPKVKKNVSENKFCASYDIGDRQTQNKTEHPTENLKRDKKDRIEKESISHLENQTSGNNENCATHYKENCRESTSSIKELVAGDLELSDETCDNLEIQKTPFTDKPQNKDKNSTDHENIDKTSAPLQNKTTGQDVILNENIEKEITQEKPPHDIIQDDCRKRNSKKKLSKIKETPKIAKVDVTDKETDTKTKSKRDTKDSKVIKTKFSELFGDNSSLITPEDLGIMAVQAQTQPSASYVPICEDAQDAVDITVSNVQKVQTRLSKLKSLETVQTKECLETVNDDQKTETKTKSKSSNGTKKKSRKNHAQLADKSKIREVYQSLTADKLVTENGVSSRNLVENEAVKEIPTDAIADEPIQIVKIIAEEQSHTVAEKSDFSKKPQLVDKDTVTPPNIEILLKPNILMTALATSTPQKELQQDNSGIGDGVVVGGQASNCPSSSKETSYENMAAEKSSNNETLNSQNDTDVPDVRIFVRRKRRVKIPKTS